VKIYRIRPGYLRTAVTIETLKDKPWARCKGLAIDSGLRAEEVTSAPNREVGLLEQPVEVPIADSSSATAPKRNISHPLQSSELRTNESTKAVKPPLDGLRIEEHELIPIPTPSSNDEELGEASNDIQSGENPDESDDSVAPVSQRPHS
jgi:hypothetical protein